MLLFKYKVNEATSTATDDCPAPRDLEVYLYSQFLFGTRLSNYRNIPTKSSSVCIGTLSFILMSLKNISDTRNRKTEASAKT